MPVLLVVGLDNTNEQSLKHSSSPQMRATPIFSYGLLIPGEVTLARTTFGDCAGHESSEKLTLRRIQSPKYKSNYIDLYLYISIYKAIFINKIQ